MRQEYGLIELLPCECQPGFDLRIELTLCFEIDRNVLLSVHFFARRDEFLSGRFVEEGDAGAVHGEDGGNGESAG